MQNNRNQERGFTLVEVVIGAALFFMLLGSASMAVVQTQKTAHSNVMHNTARTVLTGYVEQLRGIPYAVWEEVLADPVNVPFPTKSVNILATEDIEVEDPLYLDQENLKEVVLDIITHEDQSQSLYTMDVTVTPTVTDLFPTEGIKAFDVTLDFKYKSLYTGYENEHARSIRFVKTAISEY